MPGVTMQALTSAGAIICAFAFSTQASGQALAVRQPPAVRVVHSRAPAPPVLVVRPPRIPRGYRGHYVIDSKVNWLAAPTPFVGKDAPLIYSSHLFPGGWR